MNLYDAKMVLAGERDRLRTERRECIAQFRKAINKLIVETPTSDLRNDITELNVLFEYNLSLEEESLKV